MSISVYAMPIIILNMGGEMMYILNQRLQAQGVSQEKGSKVLQDVVKAMFLPNFLDELFKPQKIYTMKATREIFEKLAHSSIMRLNKTSMDKLFDLMTMGFKRQILCCINPQDYIIVSFNHLESIKLLSKAPIVHDNVNDAIQRMISYYAKLTIADFFRLKQSLYGFLQDKKTKVSLFLHNNFQLRDGTFSIPSPSILPYCTDIPGMIRYYDGKTVAMTTAFTTLNGQNSVYKASEIMNSETTLGLNLFTLYQQKTSGKDTDMMTSPSPSSSPDAKNTTTIEATPLSPTTTTTVASSSSQIQEKDILTIPTVINLYKTIYKLYSLLTPLYDDGTVYNATQVYMNDKDSAAMRKLPSPTHHSHMSSLSSSGAKAELNLLADLLGTSMSLSSPDSKHTADSKGGGSSSSSSSSYMNTFKLSLFPGDEDFLGESKSPTGGSHESSVIEIDTTIDMKTMNRYLEEWDMIDGPSGSSSSGSSTSAMKYAESKSSSQHHPGHKSTVIDDEDDDLLALMDSVK